ncbi:LacI family DNA-binding transcriptional regulator [Modestobacter sp. SYSU DS0290]
MAGSRAQRVTLQSIADELGVSAKTVSNAYGRPDQLSPELRQRILAAAERLGYPGPDPVAAGLRRGRVGAVGVAYDNGLAYAFDDPVSVELLAGVSGVVEPAGAGLLLIPGSADDDRRTAALGSALLDGLVLSSVADDDPLLSAAVARRTPLVVVDQPRPGRLAELAPRGVAWVGVDDEAAAVAACRHVLAAGHRRLAVLSFGMHRLPIDPGLVGLQEQGGATYAVTRDRLAGYRQAAEAVGVDWSSVPVFHAPDSTPDDGAAGAEVLLGLTPRPTVLLCLSDRLAEGALRVAAARGIRVPGDLSVLGFDDARNAAELGLSTVRQPTREKGERAARALLELIRGGTPDRTPVVLPTDLVVRGSTGAAPG